jgi:hypothetical protein
MRFYGSSTIFIAGSDSKIDRNSLASFFTSFAVSIFFEDPLEKWNLVFKQIGSNYYVGAASRRDVNAISGTCRGETPLPQSEVGLS